VKKIICILIAIALIMSAIPICASAEDKNYVDGEIILKYTPPLTLSGVSENSLHQQLTEAGISSCSMIECYDDSLELSSVFDEEEYYLVKTNEDVITTCDKLEKINGVEYAEPNYILSTYEYTVPAEVTDSFDYIDNQHWYFDDVLKIPEAWEEYQTTGQNVTVAVIDNGFNLDAKDFPTNLWNDENGNHGWNAAENNADLSPTLYVNGKPVTNADHGTHVASTVGMSANTTGGLGVAYGSELMLIKASDDEARMTIASIVSALHYAANNGADVINMSLGSTDKSSAEKEAINYAYAKGCTIIAAAGNSGKSSDTEPAYPAAFPNVIGVMASDRNKMNELALFSNYGSLYDVAVPGVDILGSTSNSTDLVLKKGTSMASPIVTGLAALYISANNACTNDEVCDAIRNSPVNYVIKNNTYFKSSDAMSLMGYNTQTGQPCGDFVFNSNGGASTTFENIVVGETFGELPVPVREGYAFDGWYTAKSGGTKINETTIFDGTYSTAYARWHAMEYTVTLNSYGGSYDDETISLTYNSDYWSLPIPEKEGWYFVGWYTDAQFKNPAKVDALGSYSFYSVKIARDHTVYAKWSSGRDIPIHFKDNTTYQQINDIYVNYGESYGALPVPASKNGYEFVGWSLTENSDELTTEESVVEIPYEHTLYAIWKTRNVTVTFDANEGSCSVTNISVRYGAFYPIELMPIPTLDGMFFVGWYDADGNPAMEIKFGKINIYPVNIPEDHTLYARWSDGQNVIVHFVDEFTKQTFEDATVNYGDNYSVPVPQDVAGYTFLGWSEYSNGTEDFITDESTVITACEHTLFAIWQYDGFIFNEDSGLVFDSENKLIYGFDLNNLTDETIINAFSNPNIQLEKPCGAIGTGTKINLIDKDGNVYNTAKVVIFGDVNCDGKIDSTDSVIAMCIANGMIVADKSVTTAADCNRDGNIDEADYQNMSDAGLSMYEIPQKETEITVNSIDNNPRSIDIISFLSSLINFILSIFNRI